MSAPCCVSETIPVLFSRRLCAPAAEVAELAAQLQLAAPLEELLMQAQLLEQLPLGVSGSSSRLAGPTARGIPDGETQSCWWTLLVVRQCCQVKPGQSQLAAQMSAPRALDDVRHVAASVPPRKGMLSTLHAAL